MKKIVLILGLMITLIMTSFTVAIAATGDAELVASSTQVKPGDTFTVKLHVTSADEINGIITTYTYSTGLLELTGHTAGTNFSDLNGDSTSNIEVMISSGSSTEADVFVLTFKVKETATVGEIATINTGIITLDTNASTNSEVEIPAKEVTVEIISDSASDDEPSSETNTNTSNSSSNTTNNNTNISDNTTSNTETNVANSNVNGSTSGNSTNTSTSTPTTNTKTITSGTKSDSTTANTILPKTGILTITGISIIALGALTVVTYKKLKDYKDVK